MSIINIILFASAMYLVCGLVFAIFFVTKGADKIDEGVHGSGIGFRIIIIPGTVVFWPILLKKWIQIQEQTND